MIAPLLEITDGNCIDKWVKLYIHYDNRYLFRTIQFEDVIAITCNVIRKFCEDNNITDKWIEDYLHRIIELTKDMEFYEENLTNECWDDFEITLTMAFNTIAQQIDKYLYNKKEDIGKVPLDLLPPELLREMAKCYEFGNNKYQKDNWKQGFDYSLLYAAAMRHMLKWWDGEDLDEESGLSHLTHAAWNMWTLLWQQNHEKGKDNRDKLN